MIKFISLASGSSGNCYYFTNGKVTFLIDAGVGPRSAKKILEEHGLSLQSIDFILVTHDHIDHIKALGIIAEKFNKPVYATQKLIDSFENHSCTRGRLWGRVKAIDVLQQTEVEGVTFTPFPVPHDAAQTVGYFIEFDGKKITLVTDCASVNEYVIKYSKKADTLIFETNYDEKMLAEGSYPQDLKERISDSETGHLSNREAAESIQKIYAERKGSLDHIFLCHLSDNNNTPELARNCVATALAKIGVKKESVVLDCLIRGHASKLYSL